MDADVISEGNVAVTGVESFSSLGFVVGMVKLGVGGQFMEEDGQTEVQAPSLVGSQRSRRSGQDPKGSNPRSEGVDESLGDFRGGR